MAQAALNLFLMGERHAKIAVGLNCQFTVFAMRELPLADNTAENKLCLCAATAFAHHRDREVF